MAILEILVTMGASIDLQDKYRNSPMIMFIKFANVDAVQILLKYNCNLPKDLSMYLHKVPKIKNMFSKLFWIYLIIRTPSNNKQHSSQNKVILDEDLSNII